MNCERVCKVYGLIQSTSKEDDKRFNVITLEYLKNYLTLEEYIDKYPKMNKVVVYKIVRNLCAAVAQIHSKGFMHGDLSMRNVMIRESDSNIKILDFGGSARLGKSRFMIGAKLF